MITKFIIAIIIYLVSTMLGNMIISFCFALPENYIALRNSKSSGRLYKLLLTLNFIIQIYFQMFLVTFLTKYFYDLNVKHKITIPILIPIILGISMLNYIRKYSKEITQKEFDADPDNRDPEVLLLYGMKRTRDNMVGLGSSLGLILFLGYYFYPNFFINALSLFFLD